MKVSQRRSVQATWLAAMSQIYDMRIRQFYGLDNRIKAGPAATSRMVSASAWARGTMVSMRHHSSSVWALPPTGPVPHRVGVPSAAVKPLSAEPPVASPETRNPRPAADVEVDPHAVIISIMFSPEGMALWPVVLVPVSKIASQNP